MERRRTSRHLQTAEDAGIAGNDLELPAGDVELDGTPDGVQRASSDTEKKTCSTCHGVCGFEVVPSLSR